MKMSKPPILIEDLVTYAKLSSGRWSEITEKLMEDDVEIMSAQQKKENIVVNAQGLYHETLYAEKSTSIWPKQHIDQRIALYTENLKTLGYTQEDIEKITDEQSPSLLTSFDQHQTLKVQPQEKTYENQSQTNDKTNTTHKSKPR